MAIPKNVYQTFKTSQLPLLTRLHIKRMLRRNPEYEYHFFDDEKITKFFKEEFSEEYYKAYRSLTIGAAKADFFRYAILYKRGGIYLDIDCKLVDRFKNFVREDDEAIVSVEREKVYYVQWALIYNAGHPFLKRALEICLDNIQQHRFPNDVHKTTGPPVITRAVKECLAEDPTIPHRFLGIEYDGHIEDKYKLSKFFLYKNRKEHWNQKQLSQDIIKPFDGIE